MSPEQIAEVIQRSNTGGYDGDCTAVTHEDVMKIIEDRDRLLNAMREVHEILGEVIAKAEAES